ncbi:MAG: hypothetical protein LBR22_11200 [Desulfovibrio sp.]|nr:hypothetical protein [Desulfovibrio sp.]
MKMYIDNQPEIVKTYNAKIVAVKDGEVVGDYSSRYDALNDMMKMWFVHVTFIIILCTPGDEEYVVKLYTQFTLDDRIDELSLCSEGAGIQ